MRKAIVLAIALMLFGSTAEAGPLSKINAYQPCEYGQSACGTPDKTWGQSKRIQ